MVKIGENVLIGGLALQLATFSFFLLIVWKFHILAKKEGVNPHAGDGWRKVLWAVYISCSMIVVSFPFPLFRFQAWWSGLGCGLFAELAGWLTESVKHRFDASTV